MLTSIIPLNSTTTTGIPQCWSTVIILLLTLLCLMEVLTATEKWNRDIECSFNMAIIPLTLSFVEIIIFKTIEIILKL